MTKPATPTEHAPPGNGRPTVFFDGQCSLCRREIAHYRRQPGSDRIEWVDITRETDLLAAHGLQQRTAMARLHVRDAEGRWHTGAWGFAELWSHLARYRWLARGLRISGTLRLLDRFYTGFARWRLRRRGLIPECTSSSSACRTCAVKTSPGPSHGPLESVKEI